MLRGLELAQAVRRAWRLVPTTLPDERYDNLNGGVGLAYAYSVREPA